ncbi:UMP kinase [Thiohalobacter sp. IOR34]|uniref:UMP kinase n=1 Tax=Thiohalobacter sp. IOR34 TaxID=3057176 RepID=UPI0025B26F0F|nr:UMP kinase [Thiohalobacter sp. IOR34]WJW76576.1 UMP kinase [Thiohalobacter sp. IOR34]
MTASCPKYRRILLKLSGEALMGAQEAGIDPAVLLRFAEAIHDIVSDGVQVGLVIGGGNIFRGAGLAAAGMDRVKGDQMGMLATVMNALAMQDALQRLGSEARVMSALPVAGVCEGFSRDQALRHLDQGRVVLFAAGTGNPFFTTDSAASLRAIEIGADILFKATQVDGVYTDDPQTNPKAERFDRLSYDEALARKLMVMDATALVMCRDHDMPLMVFNIHQPGNLMRAVCGEPVGTLVLRDTTE